MVRLVQLSRPLHNLAYENVLVVQFVDQSLTLYIEETIILIPFDHKVLVLDNNFFFLFFK
jgi:hypothetical protein